MTMLRQKMIEDMQLHSFSERTQDSYLRAVRQLAAYFHKPPDQINEEELRQYFLYMKNGKKASRSTMTQALCGIKFFYERTLQRQWATLAIMRQPQEKKLPVVLSVEEVRQILSRVRRWRYRMCLSTIYARGLRLQEGAPSGQMSYENQRFDQFDEYIDWRAEHPSDDLMTELLHILLELLGGTRNDSDLSFRCRRIC